MKVNNKDRLAEVLKAPANKPNTNTPRNQIGTLPEGEALEADAVRVATDSRILNETSKPKDIDDIKRRVDSGEYMKELDTQKVAVAVATELL